MREVRGEKANPTSRWEIPAACFALINQLMVAQLLRG